MAGLGAEVAQEADRFLAACREVFRRAMPGLFDHFFSRLDNVLYDFADKSESDTLYTTYFDAMQVFRRRRQEILSLFLRNLLEDGATFPVARFGARAQSVARAGSEQPLELMGEAELEEILATTNLISKAENRYRNDLFALRRRLAALRGLPTIDSRVDPLGPRVLCNSFRESLRPVEDVDLAIKLVVYKLFDKQVMDQLGAVYGRCREYAGAGGLVPEAGSERATPGETGGQSRDGGPGSPAGVVAGKGGDPVEPNRAGPTGDRPVVFSDLQRLLGRHRPAVAGSASGAVVDTVKLMSALSRLQGSAPPGAVAGDLRLRLERELRLGRTGAVGRFLDRADEDTLDLVFLLFEHILQGNDIPDPLKTLIGRLQIPVVKVALADKIFFEDRLHPARRLLNHLAQVAVGWNDEGDRSPQSVYARVEWVVDQVVARFDGDPAVFAELDAELCAVLEREQEGAQSQETRVQQELELRERKNSARRLVEAAIEERLRGRGPVPGAVSSLLYEGWQQVLLAAFLRDGTEGTGWRNAIRIVDRLVWSVQPKVEYEDRRELLRSIPELLRTLRESLAEVSYDQRRLARWFKELQALHIAALRGAGPGPAGSGSRMRASNASVALAAREPAGAAADASPGGALDQGVFGVEEGTWIEVRRDDGGLIRVKLAWRSPQSGICLFVDRRGRKMLELSADDILALSRQGTLTVLGDTPIVDRAMDEMLRILKGGSE